MLPGLLAREAGRELERQAGPFAASGEGASVALLETVLESALRSFPSRTIHRRSSGSREAQTLCASAPWWVLLACFHR